MMASLTERSVQNAMRGLIDRDSSLCNQVIADDQEIDLLEVQVDREGVSVLARFHPVATDMRRVISTMKLGANLERIADQATNIARKARRLNDEAQFEPVLLVHPMFNSVLEMLRDSLKAHADEDAGSARELIRRDRDLDDQNREIAARFTRMIPEDVDRVRDYISLIFIAGHVERIGDHCKNIAEDVIYTTGGADARHGGENY
jgi:phosphate transport system protein